MSLCISTRNDFMLPQAQSMNPPLRSTTHFQFRCFANEVAFKLEFIWSTIPFIPYRVADWVPMGFVELADQSPAPPSSFGLTFLNFIRVPLHSGFSCNPLEINESKRDMLRPTSAAVAFVVLKCHNENLKRGAGVCQRLVKQSVKLEDLFFQRIIWVLSF